MTLRIAPAPINALLRADEFRRLKREGCRAIYVGELSSAETKVILEAEIPAEAAAFDQEFTLAPLAVPTAD